MKEKKIKLAQNLENDGDNIKETIKGDNLQNNDSNINARKEEKDKENLEHMQKEHKTMCANVNLSYYTDRQKEFINLYYFQAYSIRQCSHIMNIKKSALCRIKCRINSA